LQDLRTAGIKTVGKAVASECVTPVTMYNYLHAIFVCNWV